MELPSDIYLNAAATAWPRAPGVAEAVAAALKAMPTDSTRGGRGFDPAQACRVRLAALLGGVSPERIALTTNATHALNLAIRGVPVLPGTSVVTSVTEHNSVLRPLHHLAVERGIVVRAIGLDEQGGIDQVEWRAALEAQPVLAVLNHVSNVTGRVQDVAPFFSLAHKSGAVTLLDASQSFGSMPVHAEELHADLVAFTGHKSLHGPPGTGGLYVAPHLELSPLLVGGTGIRSDLPLHPPEMPMRLEAGTPSLPAISGLCAALKWVERRPAEFVRRAGGLLERLRQGLGDLPGVRLIGTQAAQGPDTHGICSFVIDGWSVAEAGFVLEESFGIRCRTGLHCAPLIHGAIGSAPEGTIRFSVTGFNTDEEIDRAIGAVGQLSTAQGKAARRAA